MADWIRMRSSLLANPRVTRMARLLLAEKEFLDWLCPGCDVPVTRDDAVTKRHIPVVARVVVGALLPTWSMVNDTAARDGVVRHASSRDIDEIAGVPGFGHALVAVEWLEELPDGEGVQFVNFEEHNSPQKERSTVAKSGAERSREYRERKAAEQAARATARVTARDGARDVTGDVTRDHREEESRGEKKRRKKEPIGSLSPTKLPTCPYDGIVAMYHEVLPGPEFAGVRVLDDDRKEVIREFWKWVLTSHKVSDGRRRAETPEQALAWIRGFFGRARENDFLMGRVLRDEKHKNWKPDIEYLLKPGGVKQVLEKTAEDST